MSKLDRLVDARSACERSIAILQHLADANPDVTLYGTDLARTYLGLGRVLSKASQPREAQGAYEKALAIYQKLVDTHPVGTIM